jgi:hypothetical protein
MLTSAAVVKRDQAVTAANALMAANGVTGVCVFGSVARGQAGTDSDIDILVLGIDPEIKPSELYKIVPANVNDAGLSLIYFTPERLSEHLRHSFLFGSHLKQDGWIIHDFNGALTRLIKNEYKILPGEEVRRQRRLLRGLRHTDRFGGRFLFPLSHVYRIGRTVTYAQLAERGIFEFDQDAAFEKLAEVMPQWADAISTIERLAPFYARTRSRTSTQEPPFNPNGPEAESAYALAYNAVATISGIELDNQA